MQDLGFYDEMAARSAVRYGVPLAYIKAVIGAETSFEVPAPPPTWEPAVGDYSYGAMRILLSTARQFFPSMTAAELQFPEANVEAGAAYIRNLMDRYGDDFQSVYSAYNSGNPDRWKTSDQVRANVTRAVSWLRRFLTDGIDAAGATVFEDAGSLLAGALILILVMMRKKR